MATFLNDNIQGVKLLREGLALLETDLKGIISESQKAVKSLKFERSEDFKTLEKQLKLVTTAQKEFIKVEKEDAKLKKELANLEKAKLQQEQQSIRVSKEKVNLIKSEAQALKVKQSAEIQARKENERQVKIKKRLEQETQKLNSRYAQESKRLNDLRKRYKDLVLSERGATDESRKLRLEIQKLDSKLKQVDADVGQFQRSVGDYKQALTGSLGAAGQFATVTGAIAGSVLLAGKAISSSIDIIKGFEQANANLQAVLGSTREEMQPLIDQAKQLGASTSFSASQVTQLQTELAKLGFPTSDIQQMAESTLDAATAMGSDLGEQAALTGATLRSFGLAASETQRVNDVLAKSTSASALDFQKLNNSMSTIAPVAASFGFSLEGTTALLGELSNAGFDASSAATATRNILLNLADSNGKLAKSLKEPVKDLPSLVRGLKDLESQGINIGEALELTDKRSVAAFSTFLKGTDSVLALNDTLLQASGTAEEMAEIQLDTLEGSIKILNSAWEGLVLSMGDTIDASGFLTKSVKVLSRILSTLSGETEELKKSQSELNDENIETLKNTRESSKENETLANRYEELTNKVELNADERQELNRITSDLIAKFGESVSVINKETGALEINIAAVRKKILADKILESETAKNLLTEKARLETQIELANQANETLDNLASTFKGSINVADNQLLRLIESAKRGNIAFSQTLQEIRLGFAQTGEDTTEFDNKLSAIEGTLQKTSEAVVLLNGNQIELNKINEEFLALGIDIEEVLSTETNAIQGSSRERRKLIGLIEKQAEVVKKLQEAQKESRSEEQIARLSKEIVTAQIELKRLQDLGKEPIFDLDEQNESFNELLESRRKREEVAASELTKIRIKDFQETKEFNQMKLDDAISFVQKEESLLVQTNRERFKIQLENEKLNSIDRVRLREEEAEQKRLIEKQSQEEVNRLVEEGNKKRLDDEKRTAEELLELRKETTKRVIDGISAIIEAQKEASEERLRQLDEQIESSERVTKRLEELAGQQSEDTENNLAFEQAKRARFETARETEIQKQKLQELLLTGLRAFSANMQNDPNTALPKTLTQISVLQAALKAIGQGFHEGTDDTGTTGMISDKHGPITGYTHKKEQVWSEDDRSDVGYKTRDEIKDLVHLGERAKMGDFVRETNKAVIIEKQSYQSNESFLNEMKGLRSDIQGLPDRMPFEKGAFNKFFTYFDYEFRKGNVRERTRTKLTRRGR